jgi:hypothetical protein
MSLNAGGSMAATYRLIEMMVTQPREVRRRRVPGIAQTGDMYPGYWVREHRHGLCAPSLFSALGWVHLALYISWCVSRMSDS